MFVRKVMAHARALTALAALATVMGQASAATFDLSLSGVVDNSQYTVVSSGGFDFNFWLLSLDGLSPGNAITVSQGDVIHATITFDKSVELPASVDHTVLELLLTGSTFPAIDTGTTGAAITLFSAGLPVSSGGSDCTTSSQLAVCQALFPPDNTALSFDKVTANFTIGTLGQPVVLDAARVAAAVVNPSPVPEPNVALLALAGLGCAGFAARRRQAQ